MHALDVLGDPVRRRILELLADDGELGAGEIGESVQAEFGISQPAVSQHLRVLRENGFATVRADGRRRLYAVDARGPRSAQEWLTPFERFWLPRLDALGTELARGKRQRRLTGAASAAPPATPPSPGALPGAATPATPPSPGTPPGAATPTTPPSPGTPSGGATSKES
ncbi:ArsR/SmtB family transcription factor [Brachybacterium saurashtrense]|uniref:ArsR family transcriptional regulator n=1 Tax=Brachybacterium saurashtrense TaxID=556288 RepID=A0A345YQH2_9MICO|nr:metalloregulator ArsR/SmtB family transcription factor [Brachybacterium saurashtrense]AXK46174.1 ArsR family transcriptional regulator [Brachybacterium saurashtrense]RRR23914.1 ArsR family transcriptional regulator [Brachybacterium saurashtrense]